MFIHELKKKSPPECTYGCSKYNKSVDEIVNAGHKHREKLFAIKDIAEDQKEKIRLLRNQKSQLENRIIWHFCVHCIDGHSWPVELHSSAPFDVQEIADPLSSQS